MNVVPKSVRPRRRTITTLFRDSSVHGRQECLEHRRSREEQAPVGLQDDHLVRLECCRRISLDHLAVGLEQPPPDRDLVRLANDVQDHRHPHPDQHGVLERDQHRQEERHDEHDFLDVSGPPHRLEVIRLDGAKADEHEQACEGGHGDVADHLPEGDDHDGHHETGDHERLSRARARSLVDRRRRDRPADGHPLEDPGSHVGRALTDEVARHVAVASVRVWEVGRDARALDQADEGERRRGHDEHRYEADQRSLRSRQ